MDVQAMVLSAANQEFRFAAIATQRMNDKCNQGLWTNTFVLLIWTCDVILLCSRLECRRVMSQMLEFVRQECSGPEGGIPVLIAHNGKTFDYKFLDKECKRWNFQLPQGWQWMDSWLLAKDCVVKSTEEDKVSRTLVSPKKKKKGMKGKEREGMERKGNANTVNDPICSESVSCSNTHGLAQLMFCVHSIIQT